MAHMYDTNLDKNDANFTVISFKFSHTSSRVYPSRTSIIHGKKQFTWSETYKRSKQLASALLKNF